MTIPTPFADEPGLPINEAALRAYVRFLIGGTGEDEAYVASLREKFGDADGEFMGWVKPDDVYPLFDVLVVPSKWKEPFGRIVVEALAYGVPVICARSGGIAESIRENENGYTFASGQHDELITLLRDVLEPDEPARMRLAQNALQHSHRFDIGTIAARISDFVSATVASYKARP